MNKSVSITLLPPERQTYHTVNTSVDREPAICDNEPDCKICFDVSTNDRPLIQPCNCRSAYVHLDCLQQWRVGNQRNDNYNKCEICKSAYVLPADELGVANIACELLLDDIVITNGVHPIQRTNFEHELLSMPCPDVPSFCYLFLMCFFVWISSIVVSIFDNLNGYGSVRLYIVDNEQWDSTTSLIRRNGWNSTCYYMSLTSWGICSVLHILFIIYTGLYVSHFRDYWLIIWKRFLGLFILGQAHFINFLIFNKILRWDAIFMDVNFVSAVSNALLLKYIVELHNRAIEDTHMRIEN